MIETPTPLAEAPLAPGNIKAPKFRHMGRNVLGAYYLSNKMPVYLQGESVNKSVGGKDYVASGPIRRTLPKAPSKKACEKMAVKMGLPRDAWKSLQQRANAAIQERLTPQPATKAEA